MLRTSFTAIIVLLFISLLVYSCTKNHKSEPVLKEETSFGLIQKKVLNTSCAVSGCHASSSDATFAQHGLILAEGFAYDNLVNAAPKNQNALSDSLKRVKPGDAYKSLLYHKLECMEHATTYGNKMPLGMEPLSPGKIQYIMQWIEAGAPKDGKISTDAALLDDKTPGCSETFVPLAAPAAGTGYQLKISPFDIPANTEREIFIYKEVGNTEDVFINRMEIKMRTNSHHFLANTFDPNTPTAIMPAVDVVRDLRDASGNYIKNTVVQSSYHRFVFGSQVPYVNYNFPEGVALKIPANYKLDLNQHYVNKTSDVLQGEGYLNIYKADPSQVQHEALGLVYNNNNLDLPANTRTVVTKTFTTQEKINVFMLTSHTHKLAEKFVIKISGGTRDGEVVYTTYDWHHPEIKTFTPPIVLNPGEGLIMEITYNNTTDKLVSFGLTSEDEMALIFGYYYK